MNRDLQVMRNILIMIDLNENPNFDRSLEKDQFLQFAFKGTRDNQLFLTNSVSQKVDVFRPVYNWFKDTLQLVAPDARFGAFEQYLDEDHPLYEMLPQLDTGIKYLGGETIPFDNLPLPDPLKTKLQEDVKEGMTVRMLNHPVNERFVVTRKNGELIAKKIVTFHPRADGTEAKFDMRDESDMTRIFVKVTFQGRLGGVPRILAAGAVNDACLVRESEENS